METLSLQLSFFPNKWMEFWVEIWKKGLEGVGRQKGEVRVLQSKLRKVIDGVYPNTGSSRMGQPSGVWSLKSTTQCLDFIGCFCLDFAV
jgi:hypothetical protein